MSLTVDAAALNAQLDVTLRAALTSQDVDPTNPDDAVTQEVAQASWDEMWAILSVRYVQPDDVPATGPCKSYWTRIMRHRFYARFPQIQLDNPTVTFDYSDPETGVIAMLKAAAARTLNIDGLTEATTSGETTTSEGTVEGASWVSNERVFTGATYRGV